MRKSTGAQSGDACQDQRIISGGDFNQSKNELMGRIIGTYTYIATIGGEENARVIDHALVRGCKAEPTVTEDGRFVRDQFSNE